MTAMAYVCLLLGAGMAQAQRLDQLLPEGVPGFGTDPGVTVTSRIAPEYQAPGLRSGLWVFHPGLDLATGYASNLFATAAPRGSAVLRLSPSIRAGYDDGADRLGAALSASDTRYPMAPAQGRTDATGALGASMALGGDRVSFGFADLALHEDRTALDALSADTPIAYRVQTLHLAYAARFAAFSLTPSLDFRRWRYDATTVQGVYQAQSYRNRDALEAGAVLRYGYSDLRSLVLAARATGLRYTDPVAGLPSENASGYQILGGFERADDGVWRVRLLAGWEERIFASSAYPDHGGPMIEAGLAWLPDEATTIGLTATRRIEDAAQEGVGGYTLSALALHLDHEAWRNLLLHAEFAVQRAAYLPGGTAGTGGGQQRQMVAGGGAQWHLNRWMTVYGDASVTASRGTAVPGAGSAGGGDAWVDLVSLMGVRFGL
ncbi:MAG: outer membrane beta-barrel protein [Rhodospirillales bacterium]|nr:outer membrane beta-barrel protein [Rhodospirillales bacterium]